MEQKQVWQPIDGVRKAYAEEAARMGGEYKTKLYGVDDITIDDVNEGAQEIVAVVSTDNVDVDNEVVVPKGVDFSRFLKTRSIFLNHDYGQLAIGSAQWIKSGKQGVVSKYRISKATDFHRELFQLVKDGTYRSHSIGFVSQAASKPTSQELRFHPNWEGASAIHRQTKMLEFSLVGIPANEDCVAMAISKGFSTQTIDMLKMPNDRAAAAEVVKAVAGQMVDEKKNAVTQKELMRALSKVIEGKYAKLVNPDRVVSMVKAAAKL